MATVKKSMARPKPVAPARKGAAPKMMQAPPTASAPMGGPMMKKGGMMKKKAKSGASFPDLNKDGKVTKADVLVGRGVIKAKSGKKMKSGGTVSSQLGSYGRQLGKNYTGKSTK
jgi:hypothetical protein